MNEIKKLKADNKKLKAYIEKVLYHFCNGGYDDKSVFGNLYNEGHKLIQKLNSNK